jgi:maltooligosyltrehalose trehalohydrolase
MVIDYDEDQRWIVMHRGRLAVACNLGAEPVQVPITGEMVLCSASPNVGANPPEMQPDSFAILRAVDS